MTADPFIDQLAAGVRERSADRPQGVEDLAQAFIKTMREYTGDIPDAHVGAVMMIAASMFADPDAPFGKQAVVNLMGLVGEHFYHGTAS